MSARRPPATVSVDLDDLWTYLKSAADPRWESCGTLLDRAVPAFVELFREARVKATFFVVGRDVADPVKRRLFEGLVAEGHELGNHTYSHDLGLRSLGDAELEGEIARGEEALQALGVRPVGFRGPGFAIDERIASVLGRRGYLYDASTWPTVITGLARWYLFLKTRMPEEERRRRALMGGRLSDGLRSLKPYRWGGDGVWELPVTTVPVFRVPMHPSFLQVPALVSGRLAGMWLGAGLGLCRWREIPPSMLFHPTDVLGAEDVDAPGFIPGVRRPVAEKLALCRAWLGRLVSRHEVLTLRELAERKCLAGGDA